MIKKEESTVLATRVIDVPMHRKRPSSSATCAGKKRKIGPHRCQKRHFVKRDLLTKETYHYAKRRNHIFLERPDVKEERKKKKKEKKKPDPSRET